MADFLQKLLGGKKKENYGRVRLDWGQYPLEAQADMGGCYGDEGLALPPVDEEAAQRRSHYLANMSQRAGNNPHQFENCPERLKYEVGTGCMNPACMCQNCQGNCMCTKGAAYKSAMMSKMASMKGRVAEWKDDWEDKMEAGPQLMGKPVLLWVVLAVVGVLLYRNRNRLRRMLR